MQTIGGRRDQGWRAWTISALVAIGWQPWLLGGCSGGTATGTEGGAGSSGGTSAGPGGDPGGGDAGETDGATAGEGVTSEGADTGESAPTWDRQGLRRLTTVQFANTVHDLLGDDVAIPAQLDADVVAELFASVGASIVITSEAAVEQYEAAARDIAAQVFSGAEERVALVGCEVQDASDACVADFLRKFGRQAWRRPLTEEEVARYAALAVAEAELLEDAWAGVQFAVATMLQSPNFLYIVEIGEPDPVVPGRLRYTGYEMASRLAYFLWNSAPDEPLLVAAESGALLDRAKLEVEVGRMLADPRARRAMQQFSVEFFHLGELEDLNKDPEIFPKANPGLFRAMRGEVLRMVDNIVFEEKAPFNELFTTRTAFINAELADLYLIDPPDPATLDDEGFGPVEIPDHWARAGYFGTGAFLSANAKVRRTSPTLRGLFVQERFRCFTSPPPPPDVETNLPGDDEPGEGELQTMRERLEAHVNQDKCAACHDSLDPVGLSMEHFNGIGQHRHEDHGLTIDAHGSIDGVDYDTLLGLADYLKVSPGVPGCLTRHFYRYATGHREDPAEQPHIQALSTAFAADYDLLALLRGIAVSEGFRHFTAAE